MTGDDAWGRWLRELEMERRAPAPRRVQVELPDLSVEAGRRRLAELQAAINAGLVLVVDDAGDGDAASEEVA